MTDLHCHILPGIDDGAGTCEDSLALLRMEARDGVQNIALTSHFKSDRTTVEEFLRNRSDAFDRLQEALAGQDLAFNFKLGSEVYYSPDLCEMDVEKLRMGGTAYMLVEFSTRHRPRFVEEAFRDFQNRGIIPIIAHVERYPYVLEDPSMLYQWVSAGAYAQVNAPTLLKKDKIARQMMKFIRWELVHVLSTDTHSVEQRPPLLRKAMDYVSQKMGEEMVARLEHNGDELFCDQELDSIPHEPKKVLGLWI